MSKPSRASELSAELKADGYGFALTTSEVAAALQLNAKTIRALVADGQIRAAHVGLQRAKVRVTRAEVARFLALCEDDGDE